MTMGTGLVLLAIGAILRYAVNDDIKDVDVQTIGLILMIVGAVAFVVGAIYAGTGGAVQPRWSSSATRATPTTRAIEARMASPYDEALADALGDADEDLAKRLRDGRADNGDRLAAREQLDEDALHRFELAHPSLPTESAIEVDLGEVELGDVKAAVEDAAAEHDGREVLLRIAVRVPASGD